MSDAAPRRRGRPARDAAPALTGPGVEAVERALSLLEAFADDAPRLTLAELAARSGFYPSTVLRLAASLDRFGYMHRDADGRFRLGPKPLRLGTLYRNTFDLAAHVRPTLARLVERSGETAAFYVREGDHRICLYRNNAPRLIRPHLEEGAALPLDRGASAHVLMAYAGAEGARFDAIRAGQAAISMGERDPEVAAVAAPVFGRGGRCLGALNITGPRTRFDDAACARHAAVMLEEAQALSRRLGGLAPPALGE